MRFLRRADDYQLDPEGEASLLRGVKAYYQQEGLEVCDDLNKMVFEDNPQYPNGFMPKRKTDVHVSAHPISISQVRTGDGRDWSGGGSRWCVSGALLGCALLFGSCV